MKRLLYAAVGVLLLLVVFLLTVDGNSSVESDNGGKPSTVVKLSQASRGLETPTESELLILDEKMPEVLKPFAFRPDEVNYSHIKVLSKQLVYEERLILYRWLSEVGTNRDQLFYKDAVLNKLERQTQFPSEYIGELLDLLNQADLDGDFRGYVIQHLRLHFDKATADERGRIEEALVLALREVESEVAGTAMLALHELTEQGYFENLEAVEMAIPDLLKSGALRNQVTAAAMAGKLQNETARPELLQIVKNDAANYGVHLAAVGALARIGHPEDHDLLLNLKTTEPARYAAAVAPFFSKN